MAKSNSGMLGVMKGACAGRTLAPIVEFDMMFGQSRLFRIARVLYASPCFTAGAGGISGVFEHPTAMAISAAVIAIASVFPTPIQGLGTYCADLLGVKKCRRL